MPLKFHIEDPKANILFTPTDFFNTLKDLFKKSKERIVVSCLYIGTGQLEKELIDAIKKNENRREVKIDILLDKQRGTRPEGPAKESSITVLADLFNYCQDVNISLFHNPLLGAMLYNILPHRINEAIGVMHMKAYIGDDTIILSGANMSETYLSNRQDRYFVIENKLFVDCVHKIVQAVQKMSFTLCHNLSLEWKSDLMNPLMEAHLFREQYYRRITYVLREIHNDIDSFNRKKGIICEYYEEYLDEQNEKEEETQTNQKYKKSSDSVSSVIDSTMSDFSEKKRKKFFYPLFEKKKKNILIIELALQCGFSIPPIYDESNMIENLLKNVKNYDQSLIISSGYLNFPQNFLKLFRNIFNNITMKKGTLQLITASPSANSFYQSKGLSNYVPGAYSAIAHLCVEFITNNVKAIYSRPNRNSKKYVYSKNETEGPSHLENLERLEVGKNIYMEYYKPSWTFHSKGIWLINDIQTNRNNETYETDSEHEVMSNKSNELDMKQKGNEELPWTTVIGSSNYGYRATYRDLEMSFIIKTNDQKLKSQLQKELNIIYESSKYVQMEELNMRYPKWLKMLVQYLMKWFL